jgi:hypothetical protein
VSFSALSKAEILNQSGYLTLWLMKQQWAAEVDGRDKCVGSKRQNQ